MKNVFGALLELASWLAIAIPLLLVALVGTSLGIMSSILSVVCGFITDIYDKLRGRGRRWK